jgi:hypothetical protein
MRNENTTEISGVQRVFFNTGDQRDKAFEEQEDTPFPKPLIL